MVPWIICHINLIDLILSCETSDFFQMHGFLRNRLVTFISFVNDNFSSRRRHLNKIQGVLSLTSRWRKSRIESNSTNCPVSCIKSKQPSTVYAQLSVNNEPVPDFFKSRCFFLGCIFELSPNASLSVLLLSIRNCQF